MNKASVSASIEDHHHERDNDGYEIFSESLRETFRQSYGKPLFITSASGLWDLFLSHIPENGRQHYNCRACKSFVERYGGLVFIKENGRIESAIFPDTKDAPAFFSDAIRTSNSAVINSRVTGVFISSLPVYGTPESNDWNHMHVIPAPSAIWRNSVQDSFQRSAQLNEDFKMLVSGLAEYPRAAVAQAVKFLKTDALYRSEKVLGCAEWLLALHNARNVKSAVVKHNVTWLAVATAPAGFCHVKSSMIGTLLDDIMADLSFNEISARFKSKMNPLQYQRPQAAPAAGNIAQAEKIIEKMRAAGSLDRRFARLDEIQSVWTPRAVANVVPARGVFSHLKPKESSSQVKEIGAPAVTITWDKFQRTVLPDARAIEMRVSNTPDSYCAFVTAVHPDAEPILQWDTHEVRNPISWYFHGQPSRPQTWNINPGWLKVNAISLKPSMWNGGNEHQGGGVMFVLDGCKDIRDGGTNAIFPETLKSEYHAIRATIEAYSHSARLSGIEDASACGIMKNAGSGDSWDVLLRVSTELGISEYRIDRWD